MVAVNHLALGIVFASIKSIASPTTPTTRYRELRFFITAAADDVVARATP
jgi:hypothetical protein